MLLRRLSVILSSIAVPAALVGVLLLLAGGPEGTAPWLGTYLVLAALVALPALFFLNRKDGTRRTVLPVVLGLILLSTGALGGHRLWRWWSRPNLVRDGGVILVYEIDRQASLPGGFHLDDLLTSIRLRLDPTGFAGIEARSAGEDRIEVIIPRPSPEDLDEIKGILAIQGHLEFLIVANPADDAPALEAARASLAGAKADRARREKANEPPPPPRNDQGSTTFPVAMPNEPPHSYRWVEIGKSQLSTLGLNRAALEGEANAGLRDRVEKALVSGIPFELFGSQLIHVRAITDWTRRDLRDRELGKTREFFVLLREPEPGKSVTGDLLIRASAAQDGQGGPAISFTFGKEGGERFYDLTSRNRPSGPNEGEQRRHLAIVLDGQVMSAPQLLSAIREQGQITGQFTPQEVADVVRILRAGALPVRLRPHPVSETTMAPAR